MRRGGSGSGVVRFPRTEPSPRSALLQTVTGGGSRDETAQSEPCPLFRNQGDLPQSSSGVSGRSSDDHSCAIAIPADESSRSARFSWGSWIYLRLAGLQAA